MKPEQLIMLFVFLCVASANEEVGVLQNNQSIDVASTFLEAINAQQSLLSSVNVSKVCLKHLVKYSTSRYKEFWAFQMYDASTKSYPGSGLLDGNVVNMGAYDECLDVTDNKEIYGQYCLAYVAIFPFPLQPNASSFKNARLLVQGHIPEPAIALCLPSSCSVADLKTISSTIDLKIKLRFLDELCRNPREDSPLSGAEIAALAILGVFVFLALASTFYEFVLILAQKKTHHPVLLAFSVITNGKKIFRVSKAGQIPCLHGIRVISMMWVVMGHRFSFLIEIPIPNVIYIATNWAHKQINMIVIGAQVSVDTFLVLSGFLVSYGYMVVTSKGHSFNLFVYYMHRIIRLTPLLAIMIMIYSTVLVRLGDGPLWKKSVYYQRDYCIEHWWKTLFYVQNYFTKLTSMCIGQSWYLSVDTQLYILAPLLLIPLRKWPKIGVSLCLVLGAAVLAATFATAWYYKLYAHLVSNVLHLKYEEYYNQYYYGTHMRAVPWIMGLILGYIIHDIVYNNRKVIINKFLVVLIWIIAIILLLTSIFIGQKTFRFDYVYDQLYNVSVLTFIKPVWALAVCWVIFACITGYGGVINRFLSLPIFQVLSKLTYSMYLTHMAIIWLTLGQLRKPFYFSDLQIYHTFWGDIAFSYGASLILSLLFESPLLQLESFIFLRKPGKTRQKQTDVSKITVTTH